MRSLRCRVMKKLVLLISIVFAIFLSACFAEEAFIAEPELTSLTGILREQTSADSVPGTHILSVVDDGGADTPLRSLSLNLSGSNYLDNKVQVIGFLNEDDLVFEVTGISVVEALHEIELEPDFVVFKNTDFGIQIKHYDDWEVDESDTTIKFSTDGYMVQIYQSPFAYTPTISPEGEEEDTPLQAYAETNYTELTDVESSIEKIGVNSLDALVIEELGGSGYHVYRNGFIYVISNHPTDDAEPEHDRIFAEMLASFKFTGFTIEEELDDEDDEMEEEEEEEIEEVDEADLPELDMKFATFESLPLLFAGEYPASWYYAGSGGTGSDVIRHYGFSDESVTDDNELISLDVISSDIPTGTKMGDLTIVESGSVYTVYNNVGDRNYSVKGNKEYKDIILHIANSIVPIED